jgi:hypothetical protein
MAQKTGNKNGRAALVGKLIAGAQQHLSAKQSITLDGVATTVGAVLTQLQSFVTNRANVVSAQAAAKAAVATERAQAPALNVVIDAFEAFVRLTFGPTGTELPDFGLTPHKEPAPLTTEQKAVAAAKRKATREARGTMGSKQRKSVKGNVTASIVVTPLTPEAAPAPVATPAPSATPAPGGNPPTPTGHTTG